MVSDPGIGQLNDWGQKLDTVGLVLPREGWGSKREDPIRGALGKSGSDSSGTTHVHQSRGQEIEGRVSAESERDKERSGVGWW